MRTVAEYRAKAAEFAALAEETVTPALKKRYADMAECYRLLADERERLVKDGYSAVGLRLGRSAPG
jgi:hypothetical protein